MANPDLYGIISTLRAERRQSAVGVDTCVAQYAKEKGIKLIVFLPQYKLYGRAAPIVRNKEIVDYADKIVAFWNGRSKGTLSVIKYAEKTGKPCKVILCE